LLFFAVSSALAKRNREVKAAKEKGIAETARTNPPINLADFAIQRAREAEEIRLAREAAESGS
jgi:hypothetical protein